MTETRRNTADSVNLDVLRRMTPEEKLLKVFDLNEFGTQCFLHGLRTRFHYANADEIHAIYLERIDKCHNRNY